jgi:hypothetical protein
MLTAPCPVAEASEAAAAGVSSAAEAAKRRQMHIEHDSNYTQTTHAACAARLNNIIDNN